MDAIATLSLPPAAGAATAAATPDAGPSPDELWLLRSLDQAARLVRRGQHIIGQGRSCRRIWVLAEGFALRYKVWTDGKRQVFHVAMPGDMLGYPACLFERALYSVVALTEVRVLPLDCDDLEPIFRSHPRIALALFHASGTETAMLGEGLAAVGRRGACERVAHFVLEMAFRLQRVGIGDGTTFRMPLTQEQIADVLGLTASHVNRMLRRLREDGLVEIADAQFRVLDAEALSALADFDETYLALRAEAASAESSLAGLLRRVAPSRSRTPRVEPERASLAQPVELHARPSGRAGRRSPSR